MGRGGRVAVRAAGMVYPSGLLRSAGALADVPEPGRCRRDQRGGEPDAPAISHHQIYYTADAAARDRRYRASGASQIAAQVRLRMAGDKLGRVVGIWTRSGRFLWT